MSEDDDAVPLCEREPLDPEEAKEIIRKILSLGGVGYVPHAMKQMADRDLDMVDAVNTLRGGWVEIDGCVGRQWRYRVRTKTMTFLIAFASEKRLYVITGWRE